MTPAKSDKIQALILSRAFWFGLGWLISTHPQQTQNLIVSTYDKLHGMACEYGGAKAVSMKIQTERGEHTVTCIDSKSEDECVVESNSKGFGLKSNQ